MCVNVVGVSVNVGVSGNVGVSVSSFVFVFFLFLYGVSEYVIPCDRVICYNDCDFNIIYLERITYGRLKLVQPLTAHDTKEK